MDTRNIRVAFATDDGTTIGQHFGRARYYEVAQLHEGIVIHRERREKAGHHTFAQAEHDHGKGNGQHGLDDASRVKHTSMIAPILDCQMMVTRGMDRGAYLHCIEAKVAPVITNCEMIEDALMDIVDGTIVNHMERLH